MATNFGVEGQITFFYYKNLLEAEKFYENIMGFEKVIDLNFAKVYKVSKGAHIGLVGEGGYLKPTVDKPVMLTVIVEDVESWYKKLKDSGVNTNHPPQKGTGLQMTGFLTWDPEGYVIEILQFNKKPYGY